MDNTNLTTLLKTLQELRQSVEQEGRELYEKWRPNITQRSFTISGLNLAHYLILRHHDLRPIQRSLMPLGLSSLGRCEGRVMENLDATIAALGTICQADLEKLPKPPSTRTFFRGERLLDRQTQELLGKSSSERRVRIMVTLPSDAAENYEFFVKILQGGVNCVRINCAHDSPKEWEAMIDNLRWAESETGKSCKLLMDLGGIHPRTADVITPENENRLHLGDRLFMSKNKPQPNGEFPFQTRCTIPEILDQVREGHTVWIDDGELGSRVKSVQEDGVILEVIQARPKKGEKLKNDKGMNFPDTEVYFDSLTEKDLQDLDFIADHTDIIGYSFVQEASDIKRLQQELEARNPGHEIGLIAKIETQVAIKNLPELIVQAAGHQPFGVMIARGDLAVQIGYQRLAEMQEEIMWMCEAAHIPVIWATQVLEHLAKTGIPLRSEVTDAAMAQRSECVMLNKGPFIEEAVTILDDVLTRMQAHQMKKTPQLRALHSWE
ncbi:pyruvate kinase, barrel domain protein [Lyngbya aestuarii BL J]|uniref:Pyruvate kinase n=1 Tax=Lyngbya aestuarii BL J TaxID=1348334 RepID=U7QFW4_9CYAN|nr:pyruvate kinase [Lyngbya aestuarii]ERT05331.1 pyruvate kinase, barrel domain protein [Lyngbya aestuarii BL J]